MSKTLTGLPSVILLARGAAWLEPTEGDALALGAGVVDVFAVESAAGSALGLVAQVEKSDDDGADPLALAPVGSYPLYDLALVRCEKATRPTAVQTLIFDKAVFPTEASVRTWIADHPDFRVMED